MAWGGGGGTTPTGSRPLKPKEGRGKNSKGPAVGKEKTGLVLVSEVKHYVLRSSERGGGRGHKKRHALRKKGERGEPFIPEKSLANQPEENGGKGKPGRPGGGGGS